MILKKLNPPSLSSSFLGWDRCQKSPHKFSKSGHCRILRKLHFSIFLPFFTKRQTGWSKSIVLENKVAINFDFRSGAKKLGHLDYLLQSYGPKQVRLISTNRLKMRFFKMEKCNFLKILQCPDFENLCGDF